MTVTELFVRTILDSYNLFVKSGIIKADLKKVFDSLIPKERKSYVDNLQIYAMNNTIKDLVNFNFSNF